MAGTSVDKPGHDVFSHMLKDLGEETSAAECPPLKLPDLSADMLGCVFGHGGQVRN
jgi:hypothetical protein